MLPALRQPKWIVGTIVVIALAAIFIGLGLWQLDRLEERRFENAIGEERLGRSPADLSTLLAEAGDDLDSIRYRRATVTGRFAPESEVLIRSQVELGQAGFHVITPLVNGQGQAVLVNRGWVPLTMDTTPVEAAPPPGDQVVAGWVETTAIRPAFGPEAQPGEGVVFNRVDIDRIEEQMPYELLPVYLVQMGERGNELPLLLSPPDFEDEGPHLSYAVQWFGFTAVVLVGWFFLVRRKGPQSR
jgi:surfeit locus 1 family protein